MLRYQLFLVGLTATLSLVVLAFGARLGNAWAVAGLAVVATLAERGRVRLGENIEASISLIPTVFAAAIFGPLSAMIVGGASFIGELPPLLDESRRRAVVERGSPYLRWGIYTCIRSISGGVAGVAAWGVDARWGVGTTAI